ncbi:type III pantothenate kinase [Desulfopila sp. IMCC35006]|uniref:type III pantothenate kinase n=1 Tax=Desulfopila sp. IMCC35006 TaxID=2569542 RepID=UPI0010AD3A62|nr:type III pantothenate kinase [Desulfopila sp. IMCC35006]TKB27372.1 type III pantothenate kinase [Desulfopila sp. IMCC35006]
MYLVVDIGNSHTVTGMYEDNELIGQWRLNSNAKSTADELAIRYQTLFAMAGIKKEKIKGIIIASVVPILQSAWVSCCKKHFSDHLKHEIFVVKVDKIKDLITVLLNNPAEVGADRLVNAIAAWNLNKCKQVVIDFGTAITFDCVTERCEYLGGAILPGIAISLEALANKTANLPHIDVSDPPPSIIGKSTVQAMKSGILYGYGGMIDGLVQGIKKEMISTPKEEFKVVATGGMAQLIAPYATSIDLIEPMLTLQGLQIIYNRVVQR